MALDDANAKSPVIGGKRIRFELQSEDDQADPKTATVVAQKLVDAKVAGVVGHFNSGASIPASKIYFDGGIPQITPSSTNPKLTQQGFKTVFRTVANDIQQGGVLGAYVLSNVDAGTAKLNQNKGVPESVQFSITPNPALEPRDYVRLVRARSKFPESGPGSEPLVVDSFSVPLTAADGPMIVRCRQRRLS